MYCKHANTGAGIQLQLQGPSPLLLPFWPVYCELPVQSLGDDDSTVLILLHTYYRHPMCFACLILETALGLAIIISIL